MFETLSIGAGSSETLLPAILHVKSRLMPYKVSGRTNVQFGSLVNCFCQSRVRMYCHREIGRHYPHLNTKRTLGNQFARPDAHNPCAQYTAIGRIN
jgi:hypothetical protein